MRKILKTVYPVANYQSLISDLFSVIYTCDFLKPWVCNHVNQFVFIRDLEQVEFKGMVFFYEHQPKEYQNMYFDIPLLRTNKIDISCIRNNIVDFIIDQIDNGYYIRLPLNMSDITSIRLNFMHMVFIYGYDLEKKILYVSNYHNGSRYSNYEYSFDEVNTGFFHRSDQLVDYLSDIIFFKPQERDYPIMIHKMRVEMESYLSNQDLYHKYCDSLRWSKCNIYFGEACFDEIILDIKNQNCDFRAICAIRDFVRVLDEKRKILFETHHLIQKEHDILMEKNSKALELGTHIVLKYLYYQNKKHEYFIKEMESRNNIIQKLTSLKEQVHEIMEFMIKEMY